MELGVRGNPTPRAQHHQLPGGASRPQSGRSNRNPITGEEADTRPASRTANESQSRPQSRPAGVPGLNLKYLAEEDVKPAKPVNVYEYSLHTPNTASTVSWGTGRTVLSQRHENNPAHKSVSRANGVVPGLSLTEQPEKKLQSARKVPKEPSAWDKPAVPENIPAPSARHQEMYKQYQEEMKQSYRKHVQAPYHVEQDEVEQTVQAVKKNHRTSPKHDIKKTEAADGFVEAEDGLEDSWTKQRYSTKQYMKKMDAEDLLEYNKKQKLIETVLADQLSRAVISDPEQNQRTSSYDPKRGRGSNRSLHDSKVRTRTTATENLLSKRVQFSARIITRNGHDALRELTGFFFDVDNTLTIYEFKQFGKSAKAVPFICRGQYSHLKGPRKDEPYTILDVHSGSTLLIQTSGQQTLPATLKCLPCVKFRVISVDEDEKAALLGSVRGQETYQRLQFASKEEYENERLLNLVQCTVQEKLKKRGIKTVTGLGRWYRTLDKENTGCLTHHELEQGLSRYHIELPQEILDGVIEVLDPEGEGSIDYTDYMHSVIGEMNEYRKSLVRKAFAKIDSSKRGLITLNDIQKFFNTTARVRRSPDATGTTAIQAFLESVQATPKHEEVQYVEFEEYYEGLSIGVESDEDFANVLRNTWTI